MAADCGRHVLLLLPGQIERSVLHAEPLDNQVGDLGHIPPTAPADAAQTIDTRPGFNVELMAAEPLVMDPVAMAFDESSRLYVVEMRDYSERRDEKLGRVKLLSDTNGDGVYDHATVYAADLPWPTAVTCWDGGLFVIATPDLIYFKDTDGDGTADLRKVIFTGFGNLTDKLNVQALPNSLQWGPDQRIHFATGGNPGRIENRAVPERAPLQVHGIDLSFDPRLFDLRAEPGGGQWGMTFDTLGRRFVCSNSRHIQQSLFPSYAIRLNPLFSGNPRDIAVDGPQAEVFRTSPDEPWRLLRTQWRVNGVVPGLIEGGGRPSGYFTGACGISIYQGDAFPPSFCGNAFVADCGSNLIHRKLLTGDVCRSAARAADEQTREFAASRDNWFRPVAFETGPDGCLWVCDMYREVVEHPASLPPPIKQKLDLNSGNDRGRIWQFVPDQHPPRPPVVLHDASTETLVGLLRHQNGWHRRTAARLLSARRDEQTIKQLEAQLAQSAAGREQIATLQVLSAMTSPTDQAWTRLLNDGDADVRVATLITLGTICERDQPSLALRQELARLAHDPSNEVRFLLSLLVPLWPTGEREPLLQALCDGDLTAPESQEVLVSLAEATTFALWDRCRQSPHTAQQQFAARLLNKIGSRVNADEFQQVIRTLDPQFSSQPSLQRLADGAAAKGRLLRDIVPEAQLDGFRQAALQTLTSDRQPAAASNRMQAVKLLAIVGPTAISANIAQTIQPNISRDEAIAAIDALDQLQPPDLEAIFAAIYVRTPADAKAALIQTWRFRKALLPALVTAIEAGTIPANEVSPTEVSALRDAGSDEIKSRIKVLFGEPTAREAAWQKYHPAVNRTGASLKGAALFQTKCASCHRKHGEGNSVGPDLDTAVTSGKEKLFTNLIDPSREVTAGYTTGIVTTRSGLVISGIVVDESAASITLKVQGKAPLAFDRAAVEEFQRSTKSLMPEGLETGMSVEEMSDLLEFLITPVTTKPKT